MYEPVGYEAYADSDAFVNGIEAQLPLKGLLIEVGFHMIIWILMKVTNWLKRT